MKLRPRPGDLREVVTIQTLSINQSVIGEAQDVFADWLTNVPAHILDESGREFYASGQLQGEVTHAIWIRYIYPDSGHPKGVETKMRVVYGSRQFDIRSVLNLDDQKPTWLYLLCRELIQS